MLSLPLLWPPVCVAMVNSPRRRHDMMHSCDEFIVMPVDGVLSLFFQLNNCYDMVNSAPLIIVFVFAPIELFPGVWVEVYSHKR